MALESSATINVDSLFSNSHWSLRIAPHDLFRRRLLSRRHISCTYLLPSLKGHNANLV